MVIATGNFGTKFFTNPTHWSSDDLIMIEGEYAKLVKVQPLRNGFVRFVTLRGFRDVREDFSVTLYKNKIDESGSK